MNRKLGFALICAFALTAVALDASACFMTYEGMDYKATVTVYAPGSAISGRTVYAGRHLIEYQDADLTAWCVDIDHWSGSSEVTERDAVSFLRNGQLVAYLFETFSPTIDSNYSAAALGVAIWEVINETQVDYLHRPIFNITSGQFKITSAHSDVLSEAQSMLNLLPSEYAHAGTLTVLDSVGSQDLMIGTVPEPTTAALIVLGGVFFLRRRSAK